MATHPYASVVCGTSRFEPRFRALLPELFSFLPAGRGCIVDAGAHDGGEACAYSQLEQHRNVYAVEPLVHNVMAMRRRYAHIANLRIVHGGLGTRQQTLYRSSFPWRGPLDRRPHYFMGMLANTHRQTTSSVPHNASSSESFDMFPLDELFLGASGAWRNETLAFAHFDVEGAEADVVRGGLRVIARDQPIFTTELHVRENITYTRELLRLIKNLGYEPLVLDEQCGSRTDCRNLINVPQAQVQAVRARLEASRARIWPLDPEADASSILSLRRVAGLT